jgi:hypothetical protein
MKQERNTLLVILILFLALGCAPGPKKMVQPPPHSHYFPFTEVIGDYHLRLIVDHVDGDMALVFEDVQEQPIKAVECREIGGKVTFRDGSVEKVTFRADTMAGKKYRESYITRRSPIPRQCGVFTAEGEWIKKAPKFTLDVSVPLMGEEYQRTFKYEAPQEKVPYHGRR